MRKLGCLLAIATISLQASAANTFAFDTPRDFAILCATKDAEKQSFCIGYITALIDNSVHYGTKGVCVRDGIDPSVLAAMALAGFEFIISIRPSLNDTDTTSNIMKAVLMTTFPCEVAIQ